MSDPFLPGVPAHLVRAAFDAAPGNEIASGKFASPESSSALAANAFGFFLDKPALLPALPGTTDAGWPATAVALEAIVRFPWRGGRHPCLDALVDTGTALIGVESKRFEPFRGKGLPDLSEAYWRPVWGDRMTGYETVRDGLKDGSLTFAHLDAAQLVKHAFGLRSEVQRPGPRQGRRAILAYVYAEPSAWPDGKPIKPDAIAAHRQDIERFAALVAGDEVGFICSSYVAVLRSQRHRARGDPCACCGTAFRSWRLSAPGSVLTTSRIGRPHGGPPCKRPHHARFRVGWLAGPLGRKSAPARTVDLASVRIVENVRRDAAC